MKLSARLPRLESRIGALTSLIDREINISPRRTREIYLIERALMQLQVEWEHFVRGVILDSALGFFTDGSGKTIVGHQLNLGSRDAAAHHLVSLYPRRPMEPDWYLPNQAIDAAMRLGTSNLPTISAELGVTPWLIDDLRHLRNFVAHRSKRSAVTLRNSNLLSARGGQIDVVSVAESYGATGLRRFEEWSRFAAGVARRMTS